MTLHSQIHGVSQDLNSQYGEVSERTGAKDSYTWELWCSAYVEAMGTGWPYPYHCSQEPPLLLSGAYPTSALPHNPLLILLTTVLSS